MTLREALAATTRALSQGGSPTPSRDARALVAHAAGIEPHRVMLDPDHPLDARAQDWLADATQDRLAHRPVAQIIGYRLFWGRRFAVTRDTLDPRPETEILVEQALRAPFRRVLDLGTGTGCILLSLLAERPEATGLGTDLSAAALQVALENAHALELGDRVGFAHGAWWEAVTGQFDLIVSNPPYIPGADLADLAADVRLWEPHIALSPGQDGLEAYRILAGHLAQHLAPGGRALFEFGINQAPQVTEIFEKNGLATQAHRDFDGRDRCLEVTAASPCAPPV